MKSINLAYRLKMKKRFTFVAILFFSLTCFAQNKDADAVFEKIIKEYTLNRDGSITYHYFKQLKLQSRLSFNRLYGETFIVYDPQFQELKINESYTIKADSTRVRTPENAFNEVLPHSAAHSAAYNHLREMVVTHTALEVGATIVLDYTITTHQGYWPALMGNEVIRESSPVTKMEVIVNVPVDVDLQYKMFNLRTAPEIIVKGNEKIFTWKFAGLPAAPHERFRGACLPGTPRLLFSTAKNMEAVKEWMAQQLQRKGSPANDLLQLARKTKDESQDEIKVMRALQRFVVDDIGTLGVSLAEAGFRARRPELVWQSNAGTAFEKSVLLTTLLNLADIQAVTVLAAPGKFFDPAVGDLFLFQDVLVYATTKSNGDFLLSATHTDNQGLQYREAGKVLIPLKRTQGELNAIKLKAVENKIAMEAGLTFDDSLHLSGTANLMLTYAANPFFKLAENPASIKKMLTGNLVCKKEGSVKVLNSNPAKSEVTVRIGSADTPEQEAGFYTFILPEFVSGFTNFHIAYLESEREDPFVLPYPVSEKYEFTLEIPEGYRFENLKVKETIKHKSGSATISILPKGNRMEIVRTLDLNQKIISVSDYADFREVVNTWLNKNYRKVVFTKNKTGNAPGKDEKDSRGGGKDKGKDSGKRSR